MFVLAIVVAAVLAALIGGATPAWAATCTDAQLVPRIAELSITQGAPGYARFARGKDGLVRAYLTLPTTCTLSTKGTSAQSITPVSASLEVKHGATVVETLQNYNAPLSGSLTTATQVFSTSDPFFDVPAADFIHLLTDSFNVTFTLNVTYIRKNGSTSTTQTLMGTTTNGGVKTVTVDKQTNALRVLVVPMGDPTSSNIQWSTTAQDSLNSSELRLQNTMANTVRALPVPQGVTPQLTTGSIGGIRYRINDPLLDVKSLNLYKTSGGSTKFCASGSNWNNTSLVTSGPLAGQTLKSQLLQRLSDYNEANVPPADVVLGVIDGSIAWKSSDGLGCDDGRATGPDPSTRTPGQVGWVRLSTDSYPTPLQMELLHTLGIVDSSVSLSGHSSLVEADGATNKGYNVTQKKVVSTGSTTGTLNTNDHSLMNYNTTSIPYTKDNTLLEPRDWIDALCDLGGIESQTPTPFATCTLSAALGTSDGVAGGHNFFQISGSLTGTDVEVTWAKGNVPGDIELGTADANSPLHLLLCAGPCSSDPNKKDVGLAVLPDGGHTNIFGGFDLNIGDGFNALVEMDTLHTDAELRLNGTTVYTVSTSDADPNITSTTTTAAPGTVLRSFTPHSSSGGEIPTITNLCCNGRAVAFDGTNLYVTVTGAESSSPEKLRIYKLRTSDGRILESKKTGTGIGALGYDAATGHFYGGDYDFFTTTPTGQVWDINYNGAEDVDTGEIPKTPLFTFNDTACGFSGALIDGLEYYTGGRLAISGDICDTVFLKTLAGAAVDPPPSEVATDNNSGITTDGAGGLWLARLSTAGAEGSTRLTRVNLQGNVLDELLISGYEAEDLAYDNVTFAPSCAVWMNQATFGNPTVQAVAVPCGAGTTSEVRVTTENARFVRVYFTCGTPGNTADEHHTVATGLKPGGDDAVIAEYADDLFCSQGTPTFLSEASNGIESTGLDDPEGQEPVSAPVQTATPHISAPLNGTRVRRGSLFPIEGHAFDHDQGEIVSGLKWYLDGVLIESGKTEFDHQMSPTATLGDHILKLEATDSQGNVTFTTVTINVRPAVCSSTSGC